MSPQHLNGQRLVATLLREDKASCAVLLVPVAPGSSRENGQRQTNGGRTTTKLIVNSALRHNTFRV